MNISLWNLLPYASLYELGKLHDQLANIPTSSELESTLRGLRYHGRT